MSHSTPLGRKLVLAATSAILTGGLLSGVASADTALPEASTTSSSAVSSGLSGSWTVDAKRAAFDIFNCKYHPYHPWCRGR
ncbi:MAG: hypothetical protein ACTH2Y_09325 [Corynebacterium sp.]|uniref:hypothetical protein n=1 Tax=unclassified Corynebacterium TaxID=2624378 RepID=UPI002649167A|nr:hypothetical protein [Corynebacterium sp.]MDN6400171.1 hypothetical protein [Brachybacterium sp.]MDN5582010.1 hypothetical protein [Corynebacterium sp.]MDN5719353.1 hypothetical protein [Corynebacterium sp.]MDN6258387.1 hypothetical protein [Corynebacterium sp.]MDN6325007.1 hypothetical protein [Corynebacterium sp.]